LILGLLLCGYTNPTTYLYIPIIAGFYGWRLWKGRGNKKAFAALWRQPDWLSFVGLSLLLGVQLVLIKLHGVPAMPGYLDTPLPGMAGR
jgi:hypothetical protein